MGWWRITKYVPPLSMPMLQRLIRFVRSAGAASEAGTIRDGFLSWHAESHALLAPMGASFALMAVGRMRLLGLLVTAVLYGNRGENPFQPKLVEDIRQERHYAAMGLMIGIGLGMMVRAWAGLEVVPESAAALIEGT